MAFTTGTVAVGEYFEKLRPMAFGLSLLGGGAANMLFPWISTSLIEYYGWRGALMCTSGLVLHICVSAILIRPIESLQKTADFNNDSSYDKTAKKPSCMAQTVIIMRNKGFLFQSVNTFFLMFSASVVYTHISAYADAAGLPREWRSLLVSILGAAALGKTNC